MSQRVSHLCLLLPLAAVLFSMNIGGYDLWPADEPRFGEVAREMMQRGDWLVPTVNDQPYQEKPPLLFWATMVVSKPFGDVSAATARIPSVVGGVGMVLLTYLLAASMFGPRIGLWAGVILMTCFRVWWEARTARTDMLLGCALAAALYGFWQWDETRKKRWLAWLYVALVAATYAKGPMGLLFSGLFLVPFYWRERSMLKRPIWIVGAVLVVAAGLLWFVPARMAIAGHGAGSAGGTMAENLLRNTAGRFAGVNHAAPPWEYLLTLPADLLPWTLFLPWALPWVWRHRRDNKAMRFLLCWTVPALIFLSISIAKQAQYLLPLFPAFATLLAAPLVEWMDAPSTRPRNAAGYVWAGLLLTFGAAGIVGRLVVPQYVDLRALGLAFAVLGLGGYALRRMLRADAVRLPGLVASQTVVVLALVPLCLFPAINPFKSASEVCAPVRALAEAGNDYDLYSVGFSREEYVFYSKHPHTPVLCDLIGAEKLSGKELKRMAKQQKTARGVIAMAVAKVPVKDPGAITSDECAALRKAIDAGIDATGESAQALRLFEGALQHEIDGLNAKFSGAKPAFMFVQDNDWRWILPLISQPPAYRVLRHLDVGQRDVLLIANEAGSHMLDSMGIR
jgi:4-amino-4-deoxy-L-arabinose transferase-like glycosyltransferase